MSEMITKSPETGEQLSRLMEQVIIKGDLRALSPQDRVQYYREICSTMGLNYLTRPMEYIELNGRLTLYMKKEGTDQLRKIHGVSLVIPAREKIGDVYVVTARAKDATGRTDESTGAVALGKAYGDSLANLYMKAETKAKRRVTLSIVGLGMLDESEVESIEGSKKVVVDVETGELVSDPVAKIPAEEKTVVPAKGTGASESPPPRKLPPSTGKMDWRVMQSSEAQRDIIQKNWKPSDDDGPDLETFLQGRFNKHSLEELTKGEASDIINSLGKSRQN